MRELATAGEPAPQGVRTSLTHPQNGLRIVAVGVDTLVINGRVDLPDPLFERLFTDRARARAERRRVGVPVEVAGASFVLSPEGGEHTVRLGNGDLRWSLTATDTPRHPNVTLQPSAEFLWRFGPAAAIAQILDFVCRLAPSGKRDLWVSRLDLAVDSQGFDFPPVKDPRWSARAKWRADYFKGLTFTGMQFGKGELLARVYLKSLEILKSKKTWMLDIWEANGGAPLAPTWRVEIQGRREHLRKLGIDRVRSPEDVLGGCDAFWQTTLESWIKFHDSGRTKRCERDPIHPAWAALVDASFAAPTPRASPAVQSFCALQHTQAVRGHLASYGALLGLSSLHECAERMQHALNDLERETPGAFAELLFVRRTARKHLTDAALQAAHPQSATCDVASRKPSDKPSRKPCRKPRDGSQSAENTR